MKVSRGLISEEMRQRERKSIRDKEFSPKARSITAAADWCIIGTSKLKV
jgi:hypothetical protein